MPRCTVLTYQTPGGNAPVDEYMAGLEGTAATKAAALVKLLEALGYELRLPHSRSFGDGLHELRDVGTGVRLFYVLLPDNHAALLDGMTKKRDDIPDGMMNGSARCKPPYTPSSRSRRKAGNHAAYE